MLQINYLEGKYELEGNLALENTQSFMSYFETLLQYDSKIVLSLKKLASIDRSGVDALVKLYNKASQRRKVFKIFGKVNSKIAWILTDSKFRELLK